MSSTKILVGIDFSQESELAARHSLDIARHIGAELVLLHAGATIELPEVPGGVTSLSSTTLRAIESYRSVLGATLARDREQLAELRRSLSGQGPEVSQMFIEGFPADGLCQAARELGAVLTVLGSHGRTGLRWLLLGSVAGQTIRQIESDALIARGQPPHGGYRRVTIATDFSPSAARALERGVALAGRGAQIDVVHFHVGGLPRVEPYDAVLSAMGTDVDLEITADLQAAGRLLIEPYRAADTDIRFHAVAEAVTPGIVHWLERHRTDLAVIGSHGRRGVRRLVLGSVAEVVARRAPCTVLVARGAEAVTVADRETDRAAA